MKSSQYESSGTRYISDTRTSNREEFIKKKKSNREEKGKNYSKLRYWVLLFKDWSNLSAISA